MIIRDKYGWPVELFIGRKITNVIRLMLHGSVKQTWKRLHREKYVTAICRAYSDGVINSQQMHELTERFERM